MSDDFNDAVEAEVARRLAIAQSVQSYRSMASIVRQGVANTGRFALDNLSGDARFWLLRYQELARSFADHLDTLAASLEDRDGQRSSPRHGHHRR